MKYQSIFKRYELKYVITTAQKEKLLQVLSPYIIPDKYGRTTIRNLYFDTDNYRLIRRSLDKPTYKEKLRLRCYEKADPDSAVFVEIKKKYRSVVYKRRIALKEKDAMEWLGGCRYKENPSQVTKEIDYFMEFYGNLHPTIFLSYEREAYYSNAEADFRVTFDENILCRQTDLSLCSEAYGTPILPQGTVIMEIKCSGGVPLWMTEVLTKEKIYKTSFSKYGTAYKDLIFPHFNRNYKGE